MNKERDQKIAVVGGGLCGTLLAIRLKQRGFTVAVYEKRPDMRKADISAGRSINLALSNRGLKALELIGIRDLADQLTIPMKGRMLHDIHRQIRLSPYSGRETDYINSISRGDLNSLLYDEAEKLGIPIFFNHSCISTEPDLGHMTFSDGDGSTVNVQADCIFGTDGAGSAVRQSAMKRSSWIRFDYSQSFLSHGYKELSIPPSEEDSFRIEPSVLHIWPRKEFMMIGLPNPDKTFTITLFLPFEGENGFYSIASDVDIIAYFKKWFPDAVPHMPRILEEYRENPTSSLGTIKCYPWKIGKKTCLLGDAAHAIVPFYGQGMNSAFEDVVVLDKIMDSAPANWGAIFEAFQKVRKPDADAIADLAIDNFIEMRDKVADPAFMLKRKLELELEKNHEEYFSKYSLVTFREDVPYSTAMQLGREQDRFLLKLAEDKKEVEDFDQAAILKKVKALYKKYGL